MACLSVVLLLVLHAEALVLPRARWACAASAHQERIANLLGAAPAAAVKRSGSDPLLNFVFNYYRADLGKPANLGLWTPGVGVALECGSAADDAALLWPGQELAREDARVWDPTKVREKQLSKLRTGRAALAVTRSRTPVWNCYGFHEWAMLFRGEDAAPPLKYQNLPTRVDQAEINAVVRENDMVCTHYDAFVRFSEDAKPMNSHAPSRASQLEYEQPACVHANMDLMRYALRLAPFVPAELIADCLELALEARLLDMRASPYDLRGSGLSEADSQPIRVESSEGRREYVHFQQQVHDKALPLRDRVLEAYDAFFMARALAGCGDGDRDTA